MADVTIPLRSRKDGTGTASWAMLGQSCSGVTGAVGFEKSVLVAGQFLTSARGALLYRGRMTISWNANSEPDLDHYEVWHGTASGNYGEVVSVGNATTYQWNGLLPGFTHYFIVVAYDTSDNGSGDSAEVSKAF